MSEPRWSKSFLDEQSKIGDPDADAAIAHLLEEGEVQRINELFSTLVKNDQPDPEQLHPEVRDFLIRSETLPQWADMDRIRRGEQVFQRWGAQISLCLLGASLPVGYIAYRFSHLLRLTGRLEEKTEVTRRVFETAQMIFDVMAPGGLAPGGKGIRTAQRVRLMHAAVRHMVIEEAKEDPTAWPEDWGIPINQEYLSATVLAFTTVIFDALETLGIKLTEDEQEDYFHVWRVVGHIMGVSDDVLPTDVADGRRFWDAVPERQFKASEDGVVLTEALVGVMKDLAPGRRFDSLPEALIRRMITPERAEMVGVQSPGFIWGKLLSFILKLEKIFVRLLGREKAFLRVSEPLVRLLLEGLAKHERGHERAMFQIPDHLREDWGLATH